MGKVLPIYIHPHPVLQRTADPVASVNAAALTLAEDMLATLAMADGVGLAAPQVGQSLRVIVLDLGEELPDGKRNYGIKRPEVMFNPEIIARGAETATRQEGCLSLPGLWAEVERATEVTVRYLDQDGAVHEATASGLRAVVLQHEIDHLNGVLFIDKLTASRKALALPKWQKLRTEILRKGGAFDVISAERGVIKAKPAED
ncbi:MAG: peptide deformylase [Alphaproteobacteria bacterium]|nr:peptide deformylase [Alphaproteobacteria bacterium]